MYVAAIWYLAIYQLVLKAPEFLVAMKTGLGHVSFLGNPYYSPSFPWQAVWKMPAGAAALMLGKPMTHKKWSGPAISRPFLGGWFLRGIGGGNAGPLRISHELRNYTHKPWKEVNKQTPEKPKNPLIRELKIVFIQVFELSY